MREVGGARFTAENAACRWKQLELWPGKLAVRTCRVARLPAARESAEEEEI